MSSMSQSRAAHKPVIGFAARLGSVRFGKKSSIRDEANLSNVGISLPKFGNSKESHGHPLFFQFLFTHPFKASRSLHRISTRNSVF